MLVALSLGLLGSLGHCVGMCSAVVVLLDRSRALGGSRLAWPLVHLGRITTYALLGAAAGLIGQALNFALPEVRIIQGTIALLTAEIAIYFALAIIGWVPSPEVIFTGLTSRWGQLMRRFTGAYQAGDSPPFTPYLIGLLWGFLPCGLVLTALFTAAISATPLGSTLRMLVFGLGTLPALFGLRWLTSRRWLAAWPRYVAALAMFLFGLQFALRGLAAWGWVDHMLLSGVMLW